MKEMFYFNSTKEQFNYLKSKLEENESKEVVVPKEGKIADKSKYCG